MAQQHDGAASMPPVHAVARDFLAIGGRIMVTSLGGVESAINPMVVFGQNVRRKDRRVRRESVRAMLRAEARHRQELASLVAKHGCDRGNGWTVWEARS